MYHMYLKYERYSLCNGDTMTPTSQLSTCSGLLGSAVASGDDAAALFLLSDKEQFGQASVESCCCRVGVVVEVLARFGCFW